MMLSLPIQSPRCVKDSRRRSRIMTSTVRPLAARRRSDSLPLILESGGIMDVVHMHAVIAKLHSASGFHYQLQGAAKREADGQIHPLFDKLIPRARFLSPFPWLFCSLFSFSFDLFLGIPPRKRAIAQTWDRARIEVIIVIEGSATRIALELFDSCITSHCMTSHTG
ncbi:uncharacterized protein BJX67DRAFT_226425 [Aspergillus lucknowensis]|uniref:Uncharacterized protein n=1 Tax=Aspergillus lucknowensis TaxID=176173 RepID=A0ABR4LHY0_9EURO